VLRYDNAAKGASGQPVDMTAAFDLPKEQHHNWKYVAFGPDGKLYVPFGAPCNICEPPTKEYAQIRRYNPDGSGKEVIATGVRNSVGFDWHPKTKELWFTDHGRDWAGDKGVEDELNKIAKPGGFYGFPYCHNNNTPDPDVKKSDPCKGVTKPVALLGAHAAGMGIKFYTGKMFPAEYQGVAFVARKGSWNREKPYGFDVVNVRIGEDGKASQRSFITGFNEDKDGYKFWGRPAYVAQMPDGALLVSDEQVGAIYRVSYEKPKAPAKK
jgi:glucose/arabinose dehydrogenase